MGPSCCAGDEFPPTNVAPTSVFIHLHRKPAGGRAFYSSCTTWGRAQRLSCTEHTTFCTLTHEALLMQGVEGCRAAAPPPPFSSCWHLLLFNRDEWRLLYSAGSEERMESTLRSRAVAFMQDPDASTPIGNYWEFLASLAPFSWLCVLLWVDHPVPLHAPGLCFARS